MKTLSKIKSYLWGDLNKSQPLFSDELEKFRLAARKNAK